MSYETDELMIDGITEGFFAIACSERAASSIAVHHGDDGELAFTLPTIDWTAWQINVAIMIYEKAYARGERYGAASAQRVVREALGIFH
ncbi:MULTISPECIES: hypothetical protein [Burkholderia]|uniref:Uncharacterized protein n=1 Tax=Burkholderia cenocepacia TaxID=95486 RepID=A0A3R9CR84_9BURK|nr:MULTISPECIES: hypothetical protein [Burkholderia]MBR7944559.1 hypothetical protein [Burkholderia cenocepacia]MBR8400322.1 hypothetical protein [Burkholderia cenocepacia]OXJ22738.1 hypothetical protein CFB82_39450 [Burkholderia sp. HI2714]RSC20271.1 hypothetical protein EGT41_00065 [Burkholderia cenocepacia]CAG2384290.1 hypothetical protein BCCR75389_07230 [Burkholderia cenocepacia]